MKKKLLRVITAVSLLSFPILSFAQAPNLGTAASFVLFTSTGAVTNTGNSQLTGNVGTNSGSSTGFGNVNGVMHDNDGATNQAASDLLIAYNQLNTAVPAFFPAPLLGNGDTLNAGVYKISAPTVLSGNLTLNAQGNANAVFIFQIQAAFSVNALSKIKLINGAKACNVFWKVEGMVSIAAATSFKGTIVANNAAINLSTNDTLEGRALSTSGAVTLNGVLAYTPIGCGSPTLTGPAAPNLGTAVCYAIFSGNGSVTNSGVSRVRGNIGTNVGLTTGFNPLYVNGTIHPIPDGSTAACAADLLNAYNYLNTLPKDIELLYPAQFGNNLVLTPHTYLMNAATAFNGTVFLNAQGNANAVFVIKINGALTTSTFSKVKLINGTQAKNVFWKIEGAVNINDYSSFSGTIVANNAAINLATGDTIIGRAMTTNGAVSTSSIVDTITEGCTSLPVSLLSFTAEKRNNTSMLNWSTVSEINNAYFEVQKSMDGSRFTSIGKVDAGNRFNATQSYSFIDSKTIIGKNYYRLMQVDKDGRFTYSAIVQLNMTGTAWSVFPNPATDKTSIQIRSQLGNVSFTIINNDGKVVYATTRQTAIAGEVIDISLAGFAKGIYLIRMVSDNVIKTEKLVIQ